MNNKTKAIIGGSVVIGGIVAGVISYSPYTNSSLPIGAPMVELEIAGEKVLFTEQDYETIKTEIVKKYRNEVLSIQDVQILTAVIDHEIKEPITLENVTGENLLELLISKIEP